MVAPGRAIPGATDLTTGNLRWQSGRMDLQQFCESIRNEHPPKGLDFALAGLWWDAKGDWRKAHESAQQDEGAAGAWVHAYLHRKEGDASNAAYWYRRAGKAACRSSLEEEWRKIAENLLG
jgi:hypothetical protein